MKEKLANHHLSRGLGRIKARRMRLLRAAASWIGILTLMVMMAGALVKASASLLRSVPVALAPLETVTVAKVAEQGWTIHAFSGKDENNKEARFELWVLSDEYAWKYASSAEVQYNERKASFVEHLATPGMQSRLRQSKGLIMIGTASLEGSNASEAPRARERANQLLTWVKEADTSNVVRPNFTLSLGRYTGVSAAGMVSSASQRALVIVSIREADEGVEVKSALRSGLARLPGFLRLADYSEFVLELRS